MLNPLFKSSSNQPSELGDTLFEKSSSFFAWYEWVRRINDPVDGVRNLLTIMLISEYQTLTADEEKRATENFQALKEELSGGEKTFDMIPDETHRILYELIENNPKSELIYFAMKVEIAMRQVQTTPSDELVILMERMMMLVGSSMSTIQSEVISHSLKQFLESPFSEKAIEDLKNHLWTLGRDLPL